jgi:peptidyl-tRNA hydrolase, PTH1 family
MKLIVGLGNPGTKYSKTKHNFGFWVIDQLVTQRSLKFKLGKGDFIFAKDENCMFVKPTTFMNDSGVAIKHILNYYDHISISDLLVIYDDIDINLGKIKFKPNGANGGHNGLKSIIYHLNKDNFDRLKIGIATDLPMRPSEKYVLKPFPKSYNQEIDNIITTIVDGIDCYLKFGIDKAMNNFN